MILKLIVPKRKDDKVGMEKWGSEFRSIMYGVEKHTTMISSIPIVAGLTPGDVDIIIQDENIEEINFDEKVDLVGITANTSIVERGYEIADEFRTRGIKVVMGGIHVSMLPEEGLLHADAVVAGEAENVWEQVITDFKDGNLKKIYKSDQKPDLEIQPVPRYDLMQSKKYLYHTLQTARGCAFNCNFCSVTKFFGKKYRYKSIERVIEEIKQLNSIEKKLIFIVDDHFAANKKRTKEFLKAMIPLKQPFTVQTRLEIYEDEELLDLLIEAGCLSVIIGFESINQNTLNDINKKYNVDTYYKAIEKIQSKGFVILGSFMFGSDCDTINIFEDTVRFIKDSGLSNCTFSVLTPLPGTELFNRLEQEGRILHKNWTYYDFLHTVYKPLNISVDDLENGCIWALQEVFDLNVIFDRLINVYKCWNENNARLHERNFLWIRSLSSHYVANSFPKAKHPVKKKETAGI